MRIILFTNARDEPHITEWAAHHLLLGFDQIIIFDHKSKIPITTPFKKRVRVIPCGHMNPPIKIPLMQMAAQIAKQSQVDWMLYLDADEFLVCPRQQQIKTYLAQLPTTITQVAINWLMFGTSGIIDELNPATDLIIDKYVRSDEHLNKHVKCIVRPRAVNIAATNNPHFFKTHYGANIGLDGKPFIAPFHEFTKPIPFYAAPLFIAHYVFQSENAYRRRKLALPRDDNGTMRIDNNIKSIHDQFNVRDNFLVQRLYSSRVRALLATMTTTK